VITAGPTREPIDAVRYLSNESSGLMGFELARAARELGDEVVIVAGPVVQPTPPGVRRIDVVTARDMLAAAREAFDAADAFFAAAAVADWRPARRRAGKWRKESESGDTATLELVKNPDVLATLAKRKGERLVVGFALETGAGLARARRKLAAKNCDWIVWNDASALGARTTTVVCVGPGRREIRLEGRSKRFVARRLVRLPRTCGAADGEL